MEVKGLSLVGGGFFELKGFECEVGGGVYVFVSFVGIGGFDMGVGVDWVIWFGSYSWLFGRKDIVVSWSILLVFFSVEVDVELFVDYDEFGSIGDVEGRYGEWVVDGIV